MMSVIGSAESWSKLFQGISLLGLGLVPLILIRAMMISSAIESQVYVVGFSFITICLLGAIVGLRPSTCSTSRFIGFNHQTRDTEQDTSFSKEPPVRRGHHYRCEDFSTHVLNIGENVFCAGCTGLSTGAAIAIVGSLFYFIIGVPLVVPEVIFWTGFAGVAVGIDQHRVYRVLGNPRGAFRFMLNVIFALGAFLLLAGADQLAGSIAVDSYILLIALFWIYTRIAMSKTEHNRICSQCSTKLCRT
ncbi:MAG: hypothetical protein JSW05_06420 [Candidatus Thorarchaeota archaeon]|nr:MAG: hypothetical protein JSW05_06420 [Candidatus Thorarchaeota archaeon]